MCVCVCVCVCVCDDDDDDDDILVIIKLYIIGSDQVRVQAGFLQKPEPDPIPY